MEIINKTGLQTLPDLVRAVVRRVPVPKRNLRIFIYKRNREWGLSTSGRAFWFWDKITLTAPSLSACGGKELDWVEGFVKTLYHELGHFWDAHRHGTKHWTNPEEMKRIPHDFREEEIIARKYSEKKMQAIPLAVQEAMLRTAVEIEEKLKISARERVRDLCKKWRCLLWSSPFDVEIEAPQGKGWNGEKSLKFRGRRNWRRVLEVLEQAGEPKEIKETQEENA